MEEQLLPLLSQEQQSEQSLEMDEEALPPFTPEELARIHEYNAWVEHQMEQNLIWTDGESFLFLDEEDMKLVAEAVREAYPKEWVDQMLKERAMQAVPSPTSDTEAEN